MPVVEVHLLEGYSPEEKSRLTKALMNAVGLVVPASEEAVTVLVHEMAAENYARVGRSRSPTAALPDPKQIALDFLGALEARKVEVAAALLAPEFQMTFPGAKSMTKIAELIHWAKDRYQFVKKTVTSTEALHSEDAAIVYVSGTLSGEWLDGTPFAGIRFIDRLAIKQGKLISLKVWNDLAEVGRK